jgi:hypothetical protein
MLQNKLLSGYFGEEILAVDYAGNADKKAKIFPNQAQLIYRS